MLAKKLLSYYQNELSYLRKFGKRFACHFPKIARRLGMADGQTEDPHVERIIESFALLTAQIQQRLDEEMPEVTEALLTVLAPHFLRPWPSLCIVQMQPDPKSSGLTTACLLEAGSPLFSRTVPNHTCHFKTLYPVRLEPLTLDSAALHYDTADMQWRLTLRLQVWPGATLESASLRFYLNGGSTAVNLLYALLCEQVEHFSLTAGDSQFSLTASDIQPAGFARNEAILGCDARISPVYTLLQDYFLFPQKFHFLDFRLPPGFRAGSQQRLLLNFRFRHCALIPQLEKIAATLDKDFFRMHCTPAVNLFSLRAEPIVPYPQTAEYPIVPDVRQAEAVAVWSVDSVQALHKEGDDLSTRSLSPLFGLNSAAGHSDPALFWQAIWRRTLTEKSEVCLPYIAFCDRSERPLTPESDLVSLELTCYERDIPATMKNGDPQGDFEAELPVAGVSIVALTRPTASLAPPLKQAQRWQLISHLSLNAMSIGGEQGVRVLKETLSLYNANGNPVMKKLIDLILQVEVKPVTARLIANDPRSLSRGIEITVIFHAAAAEELEYFLFCRFLDRFLALYAPVNSFSRVITRTEPGEEAVRIWPLRSGRLSWI